MNQHEFLKKFKYHLKVVSKGPIAFNIQKDGVFYRFIDKAQPPLIMLFHKTKSS